MRASVFLTHGCVAFLDYSTSSVSQTVLGPVARERERTSPDSPLRSQSVAVYTLQVRASTARGRLVSARLGWLRLVEYAWASIRGPQARSVMKPLFCSRPSRVVNDGEEGTYIRGAAQVHLNLKWHCIFSRRADSTRHKQLTNITDGVCDRTKTHALCRADCPEQDIPGPFSLPAC